jgi:hypothetical protein
VTIPCAVVLAHQGGWDEFLLFAIPLIALILFVRWAERKARRRQQDQTAGEGDRATTIPGREQPPEKDS